MANSTYTYGLTASTIEARIGGATIDDKSEPSAGQVSAWIDEVAGIVNSELEPILGDVDLSTTFTSSANVNQYHRIRHHIAQYVVALWYAANQRDEADWATNLADRWREMLDDIRAVAHRWLGSAQPARVKNHVTATTLPVVPARLVGSGRWFD